MVWKMRRESEPLVLCRRPDRADGGREVRIGKRANSDADHVGKPLALPKNCRSTTGAELKAEPGATFTLPTEGPALAVRRDNLASPKECGRSKDRPGAPLAGEAMAGRHQQRIASQADSQLAAGAGCFARNGFCHLASPPVTDAGSSRPAGSQATAGHRLTRAGARHGQGVGRSLIVSTRLVA